MGRARTLALCGLDREEEAAVRGFFAAAVSRCGIPWQLVAESEADALLIDVDSMYGQMSWLRAQGGPRPIIALTAAPRADADFLLPRPPTAEALAGVLGMLAEKINAPAGSAAAPVAATPSAAEKPRPAVPTPARAGSSELPATVELPLPAESAAAPAPTAAATPARAPLAPPAAAAEPRREMRLLDYLRGHRLPGAVRLRDSQPALVVDPIGKTWLGSNTLKPLLPMASEVLPADRWEAVTPHEYERLRQDLGGEQPLSRLLWIAGLGASHGRLLPELAGAERFKLAKYPVAEREFPKHIRIASALLKQLSGIDEAASTSGQPREDVIDFLNACAAIDLVETELPAAPVDPAGEAKGGGLLGRLRRR